MVLTCTIPLRRLFGLYDFITERHLQNMGKVMLATGLIVAYGYGIEAFTAWYSGNQYETYMMLNRIFGPYRFHYLALIICNVTAPQALWFRSVRTSPVGLWVVCMFINVGMWLERFIIIPASLHRDYLPSSWGNYHGTIWDWAVFLGTIGLFLSLLFLFVRFMPMISISEMRTLAQEARAKEGGVTGTQLEGSRP
jgi:molybdopterin-containing oxidoreductase family membrane subunit